MKAVILAAGVGSRLRPITAKKPKCLVTVAGRPILDYQIRAYIAAGIEDIIIVAGYESTKVKEYCRHIKDVNIKIIENEDYENTNNMYSLYLTKHDIQGKKFLLSNGDVVFDARIAYELLHNRENDLIAADIGTFLEESMKITLGPRGYITDISKKINKESAFGTSIDLYKFSEQSSRLFFRHMEKIIEEDKNLKDWTEVALQELLNQGSLKMKPFDIGQKHWVEIDNYDDLALADRLFAKFDTALREKKIIFIDLDGTVYLEDQPIEGARDFVHKLSEQGINFYFLSNNSSRSKGEYVQKLASMGIEVPQEKIVLSTDGLTNFLQEHKVKEVFVVGTKSMEAYIATAGINTRSIHPEYVVLGYDTELTYAKVRQAAIYLNRGADLLATHRDLVCPTPEGPIPDIGSILAMVETATGKKPVKIFGKPDSLMVEHILRQHGVRGDETVFVGDRIYTDMELASRVGGSFILVLSGETKRHDIEDIDKIPDLVVQDIKHIFG
jgi:HAD superfamily hydrolase (TIGR01450 family)